MAAERVADCFVSIGLEMSALRAGLHAAKSAVLSFLGGTGGIEQFAEFEQNMARVRAILDPTAEDFDRLSNEAMRLGRDTMFTARQAAEGMANFAQAG